MFLSDRSIRARLAPPWYTRWWWDFRGWSGRVAVTPLATWAVQPSSIDLRLGTQLRAYRERAMPREQREEDWIPSLKDGRGCFYVEAGRPYLATTLEHLTIPPDLCGLIMGRSSVARLFVSLHQNAGLLDPGYRGRPTLEITSTLTTWLEPGQPIGQLVLVKLDRPAEFPYGHPLLRSHYQNDTEPTPARLWGAPVPALPRRDDWHAGAPEAPND